MELKQLEKEMRNLGKSLPIDVSNASIGEEVVIPHDTYGYIPFIVIGKDHDAPNSVTLLTKNIVTCLAFDKGSNRYSNCNLLQWLNSNKSGGLIKGFSSDVINQIIEVPKRTAICTTDGRRYEDVSSKIFLLSATEVGLGNENGIEEGNIYEYFSNNANLKRVAYPSEYAVYHRNLSHVDTFCTDNGWDWWLRTPKSSTIDRVRNINSNGSLNYYLAYHGDSGVRFALTLIM